MSYDIVRFVFGSKDGGTVIKSGLTLEEAQAHCNDPETSSRTCTSEEGKRRTEALGPWFDGYRERNYYPRKPGLLEQGFELLARERRGL